MSGVQFDRRSARRIATATKRVEAMPRGGNADRRGTLPSTQVLFFVLQDSLDVATDPLTGATAAKATVYAGDPANPPNAAADGSTYTPQELVTSDTPRTEWVVNRSRDFSADTGAIGVAVRVNGELLVFWVDCSSS
jgi:hypothetical protein